MSPRLYREGVGLVRFPRVSGDEPMSMTWNGTLPVFSPRERG